MKKLFFLVGMVIFSLPAFSTAIVCDEGGDCVEVNRVKRNGEWRDACCVDIEISYSSCEDDCAMA